MKQKEKESIKKFQSPIYPSTSTTRCCQKTSRQTFPISSVRLFTHRLSDLYGHYPKHKIHKTKNNVRIGQTACT